MRVLSPLAHACGVTTCDSTTSYCEVVPGGLIDNYACQPLPSACSGFPTCPCLADEPCGAGSCDVLPAGNVLLECLGVP